MVASGAVTGLVQVSTRDTVTLDPFVQRIKRLRRNVTVAARAIMLQVQQGACGRQPVFVTLTYRPGAEWSPGDVKGFVKRVREWLRRKGQADKLSYVWVAEMQKRGAVHYHLVLWLPRGLMLPKPDKRGWWPHGMTNVQRAKRPIGYLMKYLSKGGDDVPSYPRGCRTYGVGGLDADGRSFRRWLNFPAMLKGIASVSCRWVRRVGGGWVNKDTGEVLPSEWGLRSASSGRTTLVRLWRAPRLIDADGPFCWVK